jgi:hypothetical protein
VNEPISIRERQITAVFEKISPGGCIENQSPGD